MGGGKATEKKGGEQMGRSSRQDAGSKMAIVLEGLRGEGSISEVCRRHGVAQAQHYR